jgi:hypothetical protein
VRVLCHSISRNPEPRSTESAKSRARSITEQSQPSIQRGHVVRDEAPRLFAHRDSDAQGAAPSYPRNAKCQERPGPGPTISPSESRTIRSERDAWHQIKPSRRFAHRDFKKQGSAPSYSRTPKAPLRINAGSQPVVTWENKKSCAKGAKGVEFSHREDHRDLQVPSDPISILFLLGVNEGERGWLKPLLTH